MRAAQHIAHTRPVSITSSGLGTMGFGLPAGGWRASRVTERYRRRISGDGSFMMN
ncbi:thiamine pyrophosphate-dependent enzyme [Shigella flexneri]